MLKHPNRSGVWEARKNRHREFFLSFISTFTFKGQKTEVGNAKEEKELMKGEKDENLSTKNPGFWKPKTNPPLR